MIVAEGARASGLTACARFPMMKIRGARASDEHTAGLRKRINHKGHEGTQRKF